MTVYDPTLTADKAAATLPADVLNATGRNPDDRGAALGAHSITGYIDARRTKRKTNAPPELDYDKELKQKLVHIFNVGPFPHVIPLGSMGSFVIPECPDGQPYVESLTKLHLLEDEIYPAFRQRQALRLREDGRKLAKEIMGEGSHQDKRNSRRRWGVIVAEGEVPTARELHDANAELYALASENVAYIDSIWDRDPKLAYDILRASQNFYRFAKVLKLTGKEKRWLSSGTPSTKQPCRWCQEPVDPQSPLCHNCKKPVNHERYLEMMAEEQSLSEATAPKKGK